MTAISNSVMWAIYRPDGHIIFNSIACTKAESLTIHFGRNIKQMPIMYERKGFIITEIAIDIVAVK